MCTNFSLSGNYTPVCRSQLVQKHEILLPLKCERVWHSLHTFAQCIFMDHDTIRIRIIIQNHIHIVSCPRIHIRALLSLPYPDPHTNPCPIPISILISTASQFPPHPCLIPISTPLRSRPQPIPYFKTNFCYKPPYFTCSLLNVFKICYYSDCCCYYCMYVTTTPCLETRSLQFSLNNWQLWTYSYNFWHNHLDDTLICFQNLLTTIYCWQTYVHVVCCRQSCWSCCAWFHFKLSSEFTGKLLLESWLLNDID